MNWDQQCTDENLHRYVDGELDDEARKRVEGHLEKQPPLAARVRAYRLVNRAVREAYDEAQPPMREPRTYRMPSWRRGVAAAALILPTGFLAGWLGHSVLTFPEMHLPIADGVNLPVQGREHLNTLFHIDVDEPAAMGGVLDRAEAVLTAYADQDIQVEVVANAVGLNLLRADTSEFAPRVRAMMDKYDNLTFVACANTIRKLREQGVEVLLIDRTHARETAIDHVVDRLQDGWTYIKI